MEPKYTYLISQSFYKVSVFVRYTIRRLKDYIEHMITYHIIIGLYISVNVLNFSSYLSDQLQIQINQPNNL